MADYKTMYHKLFREMNDTVDRFKKRLLEVEDIYIETDLEAYQNDTEQHGYHSPKEPLRFDNTTTKNKDDE